MRIHLVYTALLFSIIVSPVTTALAGELTNDELKRFDANGDNFVDPDKATIYARYLYDKNNILVTYDLNQNGRIDPDELKAMNANLAAIDVSPESTEIRLLKEQQIPIPLEASPTSIAVVLSKDVSRGYLREKRIDLGIDTDKPEDSVSDGGAITLTNDIDGNKNVASITAAVGYLFRHNFSYPKGYQNTDTILSAISFGPYIEADGDVNSDKSRISIGALAQAELLGGPLFDLQRYSFAPYYQTDFEGKSSVYGTTATWQPYLVDAALGSIRPIGGNALAYTLGLSLTGDYRYVGSAGGTGLKDNDNYAWLGADMSMKIWPLPELLKSRLFAQAHYSYYYDLVGNRDASLFSGGIGLALDEQANTTINIDYFNGRDYQTETDKNMVKTALKVKF